MPIAVNIAPMELASPKNQSPECFGEPEPAVGSPLPWLWPGLGVVLGRGDAVELMDGLGDGSADGGGVGVAVPPWPLWSPPPALVPPPVPLPAFVPPPAGGGVVDPPGVETSWALIWAEVTVPCGILPYMSGLQSKETLMHWLTRFAKARVSQAEMTSPWNV
jgi:hypothetical protein